jgi:phospholipase C
MLPAPHQWHQGFGAAQFSSIPQQCRRRRCAPEEMQENRAFDHYFGMLRGVRGFGDPRPIPLPSGQSADQHAAWNRGQYYNWIAAKETSVVTAFYTRQDIPFFYALADAFTICDAYYCSLVGPTDPNRLAATA